jgi:hypothetical protein
MRCFTRGSRAVALAVASRYGSATRLGAIPSGAGMCTRTVATVRVQLASTRWLRVTAGSAAAADNRLRLASRLPIAQATAGFTQRALGAPKEPPEVERATERYGRALERTSCQNACAVTARPAALQYRPRAYPWGLPDLHSSSHCQTSPCSLWIHSWSSAQPSDKAPPDTILNATFLYSAV